MNSTLRAFTVLLLAFLPIVSTASSSTSMATEGAVLEFHFVDFSGQLVSGACLFGTPIAFAFSTCDNVPSNELVGRNAKSDEDLRPGIIRLTNHPVEPAVAIIYMVSHLPKGYRVFLPNSDGRIQVEPVAGRVVTYRVTLESISQETTSHGQASLTQSAVCTIVELYPGYPGYRGVVAGLIGKADTACLEDLERLDPLFSREQEDAVNLEIARQLGVEGGFLDWTWEIWMAVGAMRGLGWICFTCMAAEPAAFYPVGPGTIAADDPRLELRIGSTDYLFAARFLQRYGVGSFYPDHFQDGWLRIHAHIISGKAYPNARQVVANAEYILKVYFCLDGVECGFLDPNSMNCTVVLREGYIGPIYGLNQNDQITIILLGLLASNKAADSRFVDLFESTIFTMFERWQNYGAGTISFAEWVRQEYNHCL